SQHLPSAIIFCCSEKSLVHRNAILSPFVQVGDPCLNAIHDVQLDLFKRIVEAEYTLRAGSDEIFAILRNKVFQMRAALLNRQGSDGEIGKITPWTTASHQLPVEPKPFFCAGQNIGVALMAITKNDTIRRVIRAFQLAKPVKCALHFTRIVKIMLWRDRTEIRLL